MLRGRGRGGAFAAMAMHDDRWMGELGGDG